MQSDSSIILEPTPKQQELEGVIATPQSAFSSSIPLLSPRLPQQVHRKNLNLRLGSDRYEWFHALKERLRRPTNEKTLESLLAITEFYLESQATKRTRRLGRDCFEIEMGESKRAERASRTRSDCFDPLLEEERTTLSYYQEPSQNW